MKSPNCGEGAFGGNPCLAPPHVRGEDNAKTGQARPERETPPRAWGRLEHQPAGDLDLGNTPTCVGKTAAVAFNGTASEKHPHVRGEDATRPTPIPARPETPPRAWGRHFPHHRYGDYFRNTPTCVGKTPHWPRKCPCPWKHPHVRGEDIQRINNTGTGRETPPRAWGRPEAPKCPRA